MDSENLKENITRLLDENFYFYFVLQDANGNWGLRLANFIEADERTSIKKKFVSSIKELVLSDDISIKDLSKSDDAKNVIYKYDYSEYPGILSEIRNFDLDSVSQSVSIYNFKDDSKFTLYGYMFYLGNNDEGLLLFKKFYSVSLIGRQSILLGLCQSKENLVVIEDTDILRIEPKFQVFRFNDELYVLDIAFLEKCTGFSELIKKSAQESIDKLSSMNLLEDMNLLEKELDNPTNARKIAKITKSPVLKVPVSKIISFTKNNEKLVSKFKYSQDGTKLSLRYKKDVKNFISLMNDSFLHSELTSQDYEASAKDSL